MSCHIAVQCIDGTKMNKCFSKFGFLDATAPTPVSGPVGDRGEREWLLDIWEREWEWLNLFPNFGNGNGNDKLHSQLLGTGTGMKISFPIFGNGNGNGNSIPEFWEREWDIVIPGNDRELEREWHRKIFRNTTYIILHCNCPQIPQQICSNIL